MLKNSLLIIMLFLSVHVYAETDDWASYGKDSGGGHYSKARDITPENVHLIQQDHIVLASFFQIIFQSLLFHF